MSLFLLLNVLFDRRRPPGSKSTSIRSKLQCRAESHEECGDHGLAEAACQELNAAQHCNNREVNVKFDLEFGARCKISEACVNPMRSRINASLLSSLLICTNFEFFSSNFQHIGRWYSSAY